MLVELTPEELRAVQKFRAAKATGYRVCQHSPKRGVVSYYVWSWGMQPSGLLLNILLAGNPERAAEKFLRYFKPGTDCHRQPVPRENILLLGNGKVATVPVGGLNVRALLQGDSGARAAIDDYYRDRANGAHANRAR